MEMKFRVYDPVTETFIYSEQVAGGLWRFFKTLEDRGIRHSESEMFIGKQDINGKDIYDGDNIEFLYNRKVHTGEIAWGSFGFWIKGWGHNELYHIEAKRVKVIGNIHQSVSREACN